MPDAPDVIVVGAGSSGIVVACRLSEGGTRRVLLLEAGPDYPDPATLHAELADGTRNAMVHHDWGYRHRPMPGWLRLPLPRGRVVGGSSAVNTCIALRGQPEDYDEWASLGLPEWSWSRCLPAFKRIERDLDCDDDFHGREGPLPLRRHPEHEWVAWQAAFVEAARALGYPACDDSNAPGSHGVGPHAMNKLAGRRISVAEAYLTPEVRARASLALRCDTLARRLLVRDGRIEGIEVEQRGALTTLRAKAIVLCAGAINTPALLLRSGIGPLDQVTRLGCTPVVDLPAVGHRLLDHPGFAIFLRPRWGAPTRRHDPLIQTVLRYPSGTRSHPSDMLLQPGSKVNLPRLDLPLVSLMAQVGKPRGSGRIHFPSANPRVPPIVDSQLLAHPDDRALAVDAMRRAYALSQQPSMRALATHFWPRERVLRDAWQIERWIVRALDSGYHPCGSVPMGREGSPDAACDAHGHVRGVQGLVVADASLMPTIPSANIHLATLMIAERIGEWLAADLPNT